MFSNYSDPFLTHPCPDLGDHCSGGTATFFWRSSAHARHMKRGTNEVPNRCARSTSERPAADKLLPASGRWGRAPDTEFRESKNIRSGCFFALSSQGLGFRA